MGHLSTHLPGLMFALGCSGTPKDSPPGVTHTGTPVVDTGSPGDGEPFDGPVHIPHGVIAPAQLSEVRLVTWTDTGLVYNEGVFPYKLINPLFSDYTLKDRAFWIPEGSTIGWTQAGPLEFPVGTIVSKTFLTAPDLRDPTVDLRPIETRLMVREESGWVAWPYVWAEDGSGATLDVTGEVLPISFIDPEGETRSANYLVPQKNQCVECHEHRDAEGERLLTLIGPQGRQLNRDVDTPDGVQNQLERWASQGLVSGMPDGGAFDTAASTEEFIGTDLSGHGPEAIDRVAREYLDMNCAHCHNEEAVEGQSSQLWLNHDNTDAFHLGICKQPGSAGEGTNGLLYDVVPGAPDESILYFRTFTEDVGAMMPQIGRSLAHSGAQSLIARWIEGLDPAHCSAAADSGSF